MNIKSIVLAKGNPSNKGYKIVFTSEAFVSEQAVELIRNLQQDSKNYISRSFTRGGNDLPAYKLHVSKKKAVVVGEEAVSTLKKIGIVSSERMPTDDTAVSTTIFTLTEAGKIAKL